MKSRIDNINISIATKLKNERALSFGEFFNLNINADRIQNVEINFKTLFQIAKKLGVSESVLSKLSYHKEDMFGTFYLQPLKWIDESSVAGLYYNGGIHFNIVEKAILSDHADRLENKLDLYLHKINMLTFFIKRIDDWLSIRDYYDYLYKLNLNDETINNLYGYYENEQHILNPNAIDFKTTLINWFCSI